MKSDRKSHRFSLFSRYTLIFFAKNGTLGLLIIVFGILAIPEIIRKLQDKNEKSIFSNDNEFLIFAVAVGLIFTIIFLFRFLVNDRATRATISEIVIENEKIKRESRIEDILKDALGKNPEILNVEKTIYDKILSNLENTLITKLDERFRNNTKAEFINNSLINELDPLTQNIKNYIDQIQRNSIVNLFIGILGTIAAIIILAFAILTNQEFVNLQSFLVHFLPRFTFVIFIQLFAFFFLRLYKNNLEDAKYFQNELTNLTAKSSAVKISYLMGNTEKVYEILKDLALMERNFKLFKDESTIGIERAKLENAIDKSILDQMRELLSKVEKK